MFKGNSCFVRCGSQVVRPESAKLSFVGSIPTRTSILLLCAHLLCAQDPRALLDQALQTKKELYFRVKDYLGREDIRYYRTELPGSRKQTDWNTFDVFVVDGRRVFRLIARNGKPIKPTDRLPTNNRIAFRVEDIPQNHSLTLKGEATLLGRKCWVLEATLDPASPDNVSREAGMSASDATLWIDQQTHFLLKEESRLRRRWNGFPEGAVVTHEALLHHDLPLSGRIHLQRQIPRGKNQTLLETEQIYSNYRRFGAQSAIEFNPGN